MRTVLAALTTAALVAAPLAAVAEPGSPGCVPADHPAPAVEVVEYGDVPAEVVEAQHAMAARLTEEATGSDLRWVCTIASVPATSDTATEIFEDVLRARPDVAPRRYMTVADVREQDRRDACGLAPVLSDDSRRGVALTYARCGPGDRNPGAHTGLHEFVHTLGIGHVEVPADLMASEVSKFDVCERTGTRGPVVDCAEGDYYGVDIDLWLADGTETATTSDKVSRLAGADRYETAAEVSRDGYPSGASVAFLATGTNHADALAAAGHPDDGPVLLTDPSTLPPATAEELRRLQPERVVILGGPAAVSAEVEAQVASIVG